MKKEVFIAIALGFGLGLIITVGIWTANRTFQEKTAVVITPIPSPSPQEEKPTPVLSGINLEILEPKDNSISSEEEIELVGLTAPGAIVVLFYEEGEKILEADGKGNFKTSLSLAGGINQITIKAFDQEANEIEKTLEIVYSTAKI